MSDALPSPAPQPHRPTAPSEADRALEQNSYAIAYRLLGDRPAASAAAGIAAQRVRAEGGADDPQWLARLVSYTVDQTVGAGALSPAPPERDPSHGLREALRRRLARATPVERVAGALVHLAGYPPSFVATVVGRSEEEVVDSAGVLAPPPGVAYRELGDPELTRLGGADEPAQRPRWRPSWLTLVVVAAVIAVVLAATQITGPRPTLGPPPETSGMPATALDQPDHRNGGPLTQLTSE